MWKTKFKNVNGKKERNKERELWSNMCIIWMNIHLCRIKGSFSGNGSGMSSASTPLLSLSSLYSSSSSSDLESFFISSFSDVESCFLSSSLSFSSSSSSSSSSFILMTTVICVPKYYNHLRGRKVNRCVCTYIALFI